MRRCPVKARCWNITFIERLISDPFVLELWNVEVGQITRWSEHLRCMAKIGTEPRKSSYSHVEHPSLFSFCKQSITHLRFLMDLWLRSGAIVLLVAVIHWSFKTRYQLRKWTWWRIDHRCLPPIRKIRRREGRKPVAGIIHTEQGSLEEHSPKWNNRVNRAITKKSKYEPNRCNGYSGTIYWCDGCEFLVISFGIWEPVGSGVASDLQAYRVRVGSQRGILNLIGNVKINKMTL